MKQIFFISLSILLSVTAQASNVNCEPVLHSQFAAIMNAQSGWSLNSADISVGSLVDGLYTVVAKPKVGEKGSVTRSGSVMGTWANF